MENQPILAFLTDFGADSPYVAQMKCVALSSIPDVRFLDVTHSIRPQMVQQGAVVVQQVFPYLPEQTVLVAVVDPGVGTDRRIIAARVENRTLIAPDNGILYPTLDKQPPDCVVEVTNSKFWNSTVSSTFHGRDIMTPVACHLLSGIPLTELGPPADAIESLELALPVCEDSQIIGEIQFIDSFGNLITNIHRDLIESTCGLADLQIQCGELTISQMATTYGDQPTGTAIALFGSTGQLEIAVVGGNAQRASNLNLHEVVKVSVK